MVTHSSTNPAVHSQESNSQPADRKSNSLTTTPPSHYLHLQANYTVIKQLLRLKGEPTTLVKIRHTSAPAYLSRHIRARSGTRSLRSSAVPFLDVPFRPTDIGKRSFSCAAPATWNSLPPTVINCDTLYI